jgi:hypothetical protein
MKNNEIAREVSAILSKEYGGSSKRSFELARSLVKLVADRLTKRAADLPKLCSNCHANHGDSTCEEYQSMMAASG